MSLLRINIVGQVSLSLYGTIRQVGSERVKPLAPPGA